LSPEQKAEIKKILQKYQKQWEQRLKTAKKEDDKTVIKYATFITSQTQNFLDELDKNGTIDMNKYEASLKIIKNYLEKIDKHLNGE
jgi:hypothetical protein